MPCGSQLSGTAGLLCAFKRTLPFPHCRITYESSYSAWLRNSSYLCMSQPSVLCADGPSQGGCSEDYRASRDCRDDRSRTQLTAVTPHGIIPRFARLTEYLRTAGGHTTKDTRLQAAAANGFPAPGRYAVKEVRGFTCRNRGVAKTNVGSPNPYPPHNITQASIQDKRGV